MAVKLQGQHTFEATRDRVWAALLDPDVLARTLPGCEQLEQVEENRFQGALTVKVGPVQGKFNGTVTLSDLVPPESYRLALEGQGPSGFMNGNGTLRLEEVGETVSVQTILHYDVDAQVGGRIAGVGQRLLDSSARVITRQALEGLERQIAPPQAPAGGEASTVAAARDSDNATPRSDGLSSSSAPSPAPPSQAEFAGEFTKGLLKELIPPERRPLVAIVAIAVLAILGLLIVRGCS